MKNGKILIIFTILFYFNKSISDEIHTIKLKVNKVDSVKIINNPLLKPSKIYVNGQLKNVIEDTIIIDNIEDTIKLEWSNKLTDCNSMFATLNFITEIDLSNFDSSEVTDMNRMFYQCSSLRKINFCNFDTSKVTNMSEMFANCSSLISLNVKGFITGKVKYMSAMFYACYSLKELDLSGFNTLSVRSFGKTFMDCFNLKFINLEGLNSYSEDFSSMFYNCFSLKSLDLSSFTSSIFSAKYMFYNCTSLTSLDISNFDTTNMFLMNYMFAECKNLGYINFKKLKEPGGGSWSGEWVLDNILDNTPPNMVICFTESRAGQFSDIFSSKTCKLIDCSQNWKSSQKKINTETGICMDSCSGNYKFYYQYKCYRECPVGTKVNESNFICEDINTEVINIEQYDCLNLIKTTNLNNFSNEDEKIDNLYETIGKILNNEKNETEKSKEEEIAFYDNILNIIEEGFISENYNTLNLDNGKDDIIKTKKMIITFTTAQNQRNNFYLTKILNKVFKGRSILYFREI